MAKLVPTTDRLPLGGHDSVCLFSGGLDSYIGAVDLLKGTAKPIFVSHWWDSVTSDHQKRCMERLSNRFRLEPAHIRAKVGFPTDLVGEKDQENSLRGRSFIFFALAALAASAIGKTTIYVPENGLISLNVPLDPSRLGALSTRTTHPFYMARWQELLSGIGIDATIVNPYRFLTKGQMVENCLDKDFLRKTAVETMSCAHPDSIRWSKDCPKHCGHCVPCLIRRAALTRGLGKDPTPYHLPDLRARVLDADKAEGEHVRAFLVALERLKRSPNSARFAIHQPGPLRDFPDDWDSYKDVYVNGLREVSDILSGVVARPL
jgi:7-cyano-7-deazaguanine synthase in queuosine biosynthesis